MKVLKWFLRWFLYAWVKAFYRFEVKGSLPKTLPERTLFICNHESFLDGLLIGLALPVKPVFVVNTYLAKDWLFRLLLSVSDYIAVDPTSPMATKTIVRLLESGRPVVIFPEGRITVTGSLMKVYEGPAFVAQKTKASIIPLFLEGTSRTIFSRLSAPHPIQWFPKIVLHIFHPTHLKTPIGVVGEFDMSDREKAGEAMSRLMQETLLAAQPQQTLFQALCEASEIYGQKREVLEDIKQVYTYRGFFKMVLMLGRLTERLTQTREHVGMLLPNMSSTVALMLGLSARGRVPTLLNYTAGVAAWQSACQAAQIKVILTSKAFVEQAELADKLTALPDVRVVYLEDLRSSISWGDKLSVLLGLWKPRCFELKGHQPNDPAVVLFTSGSEAGPKGVVLSHRALLSNIAQIRSVIHFSVQDKMLNALPVFHSFGLTAGTLLPLFNGVPLFLYPSPLHYRVIPEIAYDKGASIILGTSTFLGNYAKHAHPYDFYRLRYAVAGAEKLSESVRQLWFEKFGIRILEGYGATETAPVLAVNTPMAYRTGTVGKVLPGVLCQTVAVEGIDEGGQLHVKGPNLMSGYLKADKPGQIQEPSSSCGEGWYDTGDVVVFDADGFMKIAGRVKRFIKVAGEMVSLEVVEKLAFAADPDHQHAASSFADASRGESLVLFTTNPHLNRSLLQNKAKELGIAEITVPRQIKIVDNLPLMGTGKVDYVTLKLWTSQQVSSETTE
jgi:acyl-[acyl-carrier-protein]-phospholipid O-acyltransferase/long-chain-fatty-acid--[acyl-carrier-protein] ligase